MGKGMITQPHPFDGDCVRVCPHEIPPHSPGCPK
jgi:hypothetical protein